MLRLKRLTHCGAENVGLRIREIAWLHWKTGRKFTYPGLPIYKCRLAYLGPGSIGARTYKIYDRQLLRRCGRRFWHSLDLAIKLNRLGLF